MCGNFYKLRNHMDARARTSSGALENVKTMVAAVVPCYVLF